MKRVIISLVVIVIGFVFIGCSGGQMSSFESEKESLTEGVDVTNEEKVSFESPFVCISPIEEFGNMHGNYRPNQTAELAFVNMLLNFPERIKQLVGIDGCKIERACVAINAVSKCEEFADTTLENCKKKEPAIEKTHVDFEASLCNMTKEEIVTACSNKSTSKLDASVKAVDNVSDGLSMKSVVIRLMTDEKCALDANSKSKIPSDIVSIMDNDVIIAMSLVKSKVVEESIEVPEGDDVAVVEEVVVTETVSKKETESIDKTKSKELLEKVKAKLEREDLVITKPACWPSFTGDLSVSASGSLTKAIIKEIDCQCLAGALAFDKEKATLTFSALGEGDALLVGGTINFGYELISEFTDTAFLKAIDD